MRMLRNHLTILWLLLVVNIASVWCDESGDDDEAAKIKRAASIGSFSYAATDVTKYDGSHVKTMTVLKETENPSSAAFPHYEQMPMKKMAGKTTVEFWPPDMDKEKFYSMREKDAGVNFSIEQVNTENPKKSEDESIIVTLPDIPKYNNKPNHIKHEIHDYEAYSKPTETVVVDEIAITNRAPVLFPTSQPTTKSPERNVAFIPRGNNKKRKSKKKVTKPVVAFVETSPSTPMISSVTEITSNKGIQQPTPIYEEIDEPYVDIFKPIRYTDVIANLSSLTEMSFGNNNSSKFIEVIDNPEPVSNNSDNYNPEITFNLSDSALVNETSMNDTQFTLTSSQSNELTPIDMIMDQLRRAIDVRDIPKIKVIAQMLDDPKPESVTGSVKSTTETATTATSSTTSAMPTIDTLKPVLKASSMSKPTLRSSKIYLAPRVRDAQKKTKMPKTKMSDEKLKASNATVNEMSTFTASPLSSAMPKSTTENIALTEESMSSVSPIGMRQSRSQSTTRLRSVVSKRQGGVRRRNGRKTT